MRKRLKLSDRGFERNEKACRRQLEGIARRRESMQRGTCTVGAKMLLAASGNDSVILAVMTDPEPDNVRTVLDGRRAIMDADAN